MLNMNKDNFKYEFTNLSKEQLAAETRLEIPIKLKKIEDIIDKIHTRYPAASKSEITFVVKEVFETIRESLILGDTINFSRFLSDTKLYFFKRRDKMIVKVKLRTSKFLKK